MKSINLKLLCIGKLEESSAEEYGGYHNYDHILYFQPMDSELLEINEFTCRLSPLDLFEYRDSGIEYFSNSNVAFRFAFVKAYGQTAYDKIFKTIKT